MLHEQLIDRRGARAEAPVVQLIRRIADDHVELHIVSKQLGYPSLDVVGVNERIGMGFKSFAAIQRLLACPAKLALAIHPCVLHALEPDVACIAGEAPWRWSAGR